MIAGLPPNGVDGGVGTTCTVTALEVVVAPSSSVATAVSVYVPIGTFVHDKEYGVVTSVPMSVVPL
jgi:hypothetical protein